MNLFRKFLKIRQQQKNLAAIKIESLVNLNISGIILDLDNTIISEDDRFISPYAEEWIQQAKLSGFKLLILSNGKRKYRTHYWTQRLDILIISPAKKPLPFGFHKALKHMQLKPKQVVVIGDGWHTDILGAWFVGCHAIQVASLPHFSRWWEKILGKWIQIPYPHDSELWLFDTSEYTK